MIRRHFFVCTTERPPYGKPSCGAGEGGAVLQALRDELDRRPELSGEVAVAGSTCLGPCFDGPVVVVYPEGTWYHGVRVGDVAELAERHLADGRPLDRLRAAPGGGA